MCNTETQQLLTTIIDYAKTAKLSEFRFIRNWSDYKFYKDQQSFLKPLVRGLYKTSDQLFKKYCKGVTIGEGNINQLLAYQQLQQITKFYQQELNTYTDMLDEYTSYLMKGHLMSAFLGEPRANADMHDFRE